MAEKFPSTGDDENETPVWLTEEMKRRYEELRQRGAERDELDNPQTHSSDERDGDHSTPSELTDEQRAEFNELRHRFDEP